MDAIILNMFEINYSQLIQYEILEKLVTYIIALFTLYIDPGALKEILHIV